MSEVDLTPYRRWWLADRDFKANPTAEAEARLSAAYDAIPDQPGWDDYAAMMYGPEGCGFLCGCERCYEKYLDDKCIGDDYD